MTNPLPSSIGRLRKLERYCVKNKIKSVSLPQTGIRARQAELGTRRTAVIEKYLDDQSTVFMYTTYRSATFGRKTQTQLITLSTNSR